jgi:hypothetical protein
MFHQQTFYTSSDLQMRRGPNLITATAGGP